MTRLRYRSTIYVRRGADGEDEFFARCSLSDRLVGTKLAEAHTFYRCRVVRVDPAPVPDSPGPKHGDADAKI